MKVLITGANGFIGKNLKLHLLERREIEVRCFTRENDKEDLRGLVRGVDVVFHLAGINRPENPSEFVTGNVNLTEALCEAVRTEMKESGRRISVLYASSIQAAQDNAYGQSKLEAELQLRALADNAGAAVYVYRLPNVFGKWSRPNYNSVVATFCHNVARAIPIAINDPAARLRLVYIDDVITDLLLVMEGGGQEDGSYVVRTVSPEYETTVGALASQIEKFRDSRNSLVTERVGTGLVRALYSTYVSYLPTDTFSYTVPKHEDPRGVFVEMLRTPDSGQFSFFTAYPGVTRGGHYHHSKTEKFLVIRGEARFRFRQMDSGEKYELDTSGSKPTIVETVPGWTHDITNIGTGEMIVMLWANELFDRDRPDTFTSLLSR